MEMWNDDPPKNDAGSTAFDGVVLGVFGGCALWAALYLAYHIVVQS